MVKPQAIKPGYFVALCLVPRTAPRSCYIGLVMAADEYGIRINLVHWDDNLDMIVRETEDFFATWQSITSMLVCTEEEPSRRFLRDKTKVWLTAVESMSAAEKAAGIRKEQLQKVPR